MSKPSSHMTVREILRRGQGPEKLAERSAALVRAGKARKPIAEKTIYSWFANGIPEKHWSFIMAECGVTEEILHKANEDVRKHGRPSQRDEARAA